MKRKRALPPWPLYRWPRTGSSVVHQACLEWRLPCPCRKCEARRKRKNERRRKG